MPVRSRWRGMRVVATMAQFPDPAPREAAEEIRAVAAAAGRGLARFQARSELGHSPGARRQPRERGAESTARELLAAGTASASRPSPGITGWRPAWQTMVTSDRKSTRLNS